MFLNPLGFEEKEQTEMDSTTSSSTTRYSDSPTTDYGPYLFYTLDYSFTLNAIDDLFFERQDFVSAIMVLYIFIFLIGMMGNIAVIHIMSMKKRKRRLADIFITHLAIADLVFLITLPLWTIALGQSDGWPFGNFMCKLTSYITSVNMFSSIFFLTCMSAERYKVIVLTKNSKVTRTKKYTQIITLAVWLLSALLGVHVFVYRRVIECQGRRCCSDEHSASRTVFRLVTRVIAFFLPLLIITVCYCSIALKLNKHFTRMNKDEKRKKRSVMTGLCIVALFVTAWLPFNILTLIQTLNESNYFHLEARSKIILGYSESFATCLAFSNSCVNPFICLIFDKFFQKALRKMFACHITHMLMARRISLSSSVSNSERDSVVSREMSALGM
ncbi:G-protein coupled receptor 15-like [Polypterus senegalus]|uniref:G-protein coupled receptor 15-like n=1 Tax=Polypterus senegalus TaxID=55291 RepID=UPI0019622A2B|nr:G-protein coupled receptor 15-like [Polypterus senegalus]